MPNQPTRRNMTLHLAVFAASLGLGRGARAADATNTPGLSHDAESIHQEIQFDATLHRVYAALTTAAQFDAVSKLGVAAKSMKLGSAATAIGVGAGDAFTLFGGYIVGRHLELVPDTRLVQAWREQSWEPGAFSLVKFQFSDDGAGTKLVFDHNGFPKGAGDHLSIGWYQDYWNPLAKFLNSASAPG
jgi:activator of HSP90 ATPase